MAPPVSLKFTVLFLSFVSSVIGSSFDNVAQQNFEENFKREFESQLDLIENQNVGCLFDKDVCSMDDDCMDDGLFGTCVARYSDKARFKYRLPPQMRTDLRTILASLLDRNYTWHHRYTQCCVRATLICGSMEIPTDLSVCRNFEKVDQATDRPIDYNSAEDSGFLSRLAKRLELLQREKYKYQLDIPEKRPRQRSDAEASSLTAADRILDEWKQREFGSDDIGRLEPSNEEKQVFEAYHPSDEAQGIDELDESLEKETLDQLEVEPRRTMDYRLPDSSSVHEAEEVLRMPSETLESDEEILDDNKDLDKERHPPPKPRRKPHHQRWRTRIVKLPREQTSKRQAADPTFIDASSVWVRFDRPSSLREMDIAGFISRLNNLAGRQIVGEEFSVNTSNREVYFQLAPRTRASDVRQLFDNKTTADELSANGNMKWTSYGFVEPQNRVEATELASDSGQQARVTSTLLVCGLVLVMIVALFVVFLVQRVRSSKWRLRDLTAPFATGGDTDYRDLCRQRMMEKSGEQREPVSAAAQQIASAKPAAGSPNSSTGSWSDDPISTDMDLALNRINKGVKEIDLAASLEHLRDQRAGLVKTEDQFEFVITAIAEEVHNVLKTLPQ